MTQVVSRHPSSTARHMMPCCMHNQTKCFKPLLCRYFFGVIKALKELKLNECAAVASVPLWNERCLPALWHCGF